MKKNKILKFVAAAMASVVTLCSASACGGSDSDTVKFWVSGTSKQLNMYSTLVSEFNKSYGKEHNIKVSISAKPNSSYAQSVLYTVGSKNGPDVYLVADANFKSYVVGGYCEPITGLVDEVTDIDLGDIMDTTVSRLYYDVETNTSNEDDELWGLPVDSQPSALYYNETMFKQAGIKIISVDEEDLDEWNKGGVADNNGNTKESLGLTGVTIPAKGYYRSENPYVDGSGFSWLVPSDKEILVFNNRIPMNWDELEDLSMLFTGSYNPRVGDENKADDAAVTEYGTTYGFFTEWWFNYGWSVGGDCLNDLNGEGEWNFSLLDPNPNYIVMGESFTGRTGKVYKKGETISFIDKMDIKTVNGKDEIIVPDDYGDYNHADGSGTVGIWSGIKSEMAKENSVLGELPSTREAFQRYLRLGAQKNTDIQGKKGLNLSPNPISVTARGSANWFFCGEFAMLVQLSSYMADISEQMEKRGYDFDVAPLPVYKEYKDPDDPDCDEVVVCGVQAGHSNQQTLLVRKGSMVKEKAVAFIKWCAGIPGQTVRTTLGFFPNQSSLIDKIQFTGSDAKNAVAFSEALEYQSPGDWWYMKDTAWVEQWCTDLNSTFRNGKMTYQQWLDGTHANSVAGGKVVVRTNNYLKKYY